MTRTFQILFTFLISALALVSCTQKTNKEAVNPSLFSYLNQEKIVELTLEADWQQLIDQKQSETAQPVLVSWQNDKGKQQVNAEVSVRGHARRNICAFPPLKLKFSEENLVAKGWNTDYKSLKLVTHCADGNTDLVLREYLAYKMLNTLTDQSFRVQLAKVTYKSPQGSTETYAFLIENNEEMAARMGGELVEATPTKNSTIDTAQYRLMAVFQYMIGNTDWNMKQQHNMKLVHLANSNFLPVPYDFDYSGMVNASYAIPPTKLPIKSVRERYFQWRGKDANELQATLALFESKKETLYDLVIQLEPLSMESRIDMLSYLDSFYQNMPKAQRLASR